MCVFVFLEANLILISTPKLAAQCQQLDSTWLTCLLFSFQTNWKFAVFCSIVAQFALFAIGDLQLATCNLQLRDLKFTVFTLCAAQATLSLWLRLIWLVWEGASWLFLKICFVARCFTEGEFLAKMNRPFITQELLFRALIRLTLSISRPPNSETQIEANPN